MSRTIKRYPGCFRNPRGHMQALAAGLKRSKIPPSSWDDIQPDKQCWSPHRVAKGMIEKAESPEAIVKHLIEKFKMRRRDVEWVVERAWYNKPKVPEGLLRVCGKEKKVCPVV